ncbi:uncharacterized protein LOC110643824 isoform X2 [Hevea brasiliensis]|uniref:uncharacterized protein LOC110643824 isoform X2 n=1 Tax=Hevea brasiliensis TaxID=3981 RepID=UPI0025EEEED9|nr:uncharacterized protein LOC110643824 isoform X2 [Hevea brasiliensis]
MAEEAQDSEKVKNETAPEDSPDIESQIKDAMRSRVNHFKEQADSLTFEGVRRLLEKDLGLQKYVLDVHKRFVKQCLVQCLEGAVDGNASKDSGETVEKHARSTKRKATESPEGYESKNDIKEPYSEDEEKIEDSPVMGLLTGKKTPKSEAEETLVDKNKEVPSESSIKKALLKRASYVKDNSEKITMAGLRRLLEEDLRLEKHALDPYKTFISKQLDEVLQSSEVPEPKKKNIKTSSLGKASKKMSAEGSSGSSGRECDEEDEDELRPKKKIGPKQKMLNSEGTKKRKMLEKETKVSGKKQIKHVETVAEDNSDAEDSGNASEDSHSQSSAEKPVKKKEASTPAYGKRVEHLKSVIKSCGMSVPPAIYKKVKQVPENKREAQLIKELEEILSKEGLSSNPSEKGHVEDSD